MKFFINGQYPALLSSTELAEILRVKPSNFPSIKDKLPIKHIKSHNDVDFLWDGEEVKRKIIDIK